MNYKYILGDATATDMLSDYRLVSHRQVKRFDIAIRIEIPESIKLEHWSCDSYSTTDARVPICNLKPVIVCKMNGRWTTNTELTGMFRHDGMSLYDLNRTFYAKGYAFVDKFGIINKKQKMVYDANRKRIWQLDRIPTDIQTVTWKTAADYPEVVSYLRNMIKENDNLSYFNDVTDDELLNTYADVCTTSNKPVRTYDNENTLAFIKYRLEDIANEKMFWRNAMAKLENERTE